MLSSTVIIIFCSIKEGVRSFNLKKRYRDDDWQKTLMVTKTFEHIFGSLSHFGPNLGLSRLWGHKMVI